MGGLGAFSFFVKVRSALSLHFYGSFWDQTLFYAGGG